MDQSSEDSSSVVLPFLPFLPVLTVVTVPFVSYFLFVCFTFPNFVTCSSLFCCRCTF